MAKLQKRPYEIDGEAAIDGEILRIIRKLTTHAAQQAGTPGLSFSERVHASRTACKKVRAALGLVKGRHPRLYARENAWFRDSARQLAPHRDRDVMLGCIGDFLAVRPMPQPVRETFLAVRRQLDAGGEPEAEMSDLKRKLAHFARRMRTAHERLARAQLGPLDGRTLANRLVASYRKARRAMPADASAAVGKFHAWRKWTKTTGYQLRLLRAAWPRMMKTLAREFSALGDLLGAEHDLSLLLELMEAKSSVQSESKAAAAALEAVELRRAKLRRAALALGQRVFADKPRLLARHIAAWWPDGQ